MRRFPPRGFSTENGIRPFAYIELRREVGMDDVEVTIPTGDSFDLTLEEARLYLIQLFVPTIKAEKALDKLWNFYAIKLHLDGDEYMPETLPPPQYPETTGARPLDEFAWVIERGREI